MVISNLICGVGHRCALAAFLGLTAIGACSAGEQTLFAIEPRSGGKTIDYSIQIAPQGDQQTRALERIVLYPRIPGGKAIGKVTLDGKEVKEFNRDAVILAAPARNRKMQITVEMEPW
jgi:hypothetical protein